MSGQELFDPCKALIVAGTVFGSFVGFKWLKTLTEPQRGLLRRPKHLMPITWEDTQVLILGLDKAGKSTLAQCIRHNPRQNQAMPEVSSTMFWNEMIVSLGCAKFHVWDIGGSFSCRQFWYKFIASKDLLIWVVDSSNLDRLEESRIALHRILDNPKCHGMPIIIVANKQDLDEAVDPLEVLNRMEIDGYRKHHKFFIVGARMPLKGNRSFSNIQQVY